MSARRRLLAESGYSLVEMLVATAIMLTVTGAIFGLINPAQGTAQSQPEQADLQQRMRVGSDKLFGELMMAGAGPYFGARTGSLLKFFAPLLPRRTGRLNTQARDVAEDDVITLAYVPNSFSQTSISQAMPPNSAELKVNEPPNCHGNPTKWDQCGFQIGDTVVIFDSLGNWETFTITQVQNDAAHLQHRGQQFNTRFEAGSTVTQIVNFTYYRDRTTNQLMRYDGNLTDIALVDNVVDLDFDYFGDVNPPLYPKPTLGSANCLYDAAGAYTSAMPTLAADEGSLAMLPKTMLNDGPWCGSDTNEFDADLLRVRKVRVTLRMQVASPSLRGADGALFANPGKSQGGNRLVPDYLVRFDISPRNLNLER